MRPRKGFTLVEMLVVITVIAVLVSMLMPAVETARAKARQTVCIGSLQEIGTAWRLYADANNLDLGAMSVWSCALSTQGLAKINDGTVTLADTGPTDTYDWDNGLGTAPWFIALAGEKYLSRASFACAGNEYNTALKDAGNLIAGSLNHYFNTSFTTDGTPPLPTYSDFKQVLPNGYMSNYYCGWSTITRYDMFCPYRSVTSYITRHKRASSFWIAVDAPAKSVRGGDPEDYLYYWYSTIGYGSWWANPMYMGVHMNGRNFLYMDGSARYDDPYPGYVDTYQELAQLVRGDMGGARHIEEVPEQYNTSDATGNGYGAPFVGYRGDKTYPNHCNHNSIQAGYYNTGW